MSNTFKNNLVHTFELISQVVREFRQQCKTGTLPKLDAWLDRVPECSREGLFQNLLPMEIVFLRAHGKNADANDYLRRFPEYQRLIRHAFFESPAYTTDGYPGSDGHSVCAEFDYPEAPSLGDYDLIKQLGRGGFGVVFEAQHRQSQETVALKILPVAQESHDLHADRLHRWRHEFQMLSENNHPNLVDMHSLEVDDGKWFFTMSLIQGVDFLTYVRPNDNLDECRLRSAVAQLTSGLIALHEIGIVHRDLKPSNVFVQKDDTVKILDFGLVAELEGVEDQTVARRFTKLAATPRYAAPEQLLGDSSSASDWYALGIMLYEALSGKAPFEGNPLDIHSQKQNENPSPLVGRKEIPDDLARLADALICREPAARLSTPEIIEHLQLDLEINTTGSQPVNRVQSVAASRPGKIDGSWCSDELEGLKPPLLGRATQLAELNSAKDEFLDQDASLILLVEGLSGEGKSSLIQEFVSPLMPSEQTLVLSGSCYNRASVPFSAIDSLIEPLSRFLTTRSQAELVHLIPDGIEHLAFLFPSLRQVQQIGELKIDGALGKDVSKLESRAIAVLREMLVKLATRYAVVIVLDDLHWGDSESANVFSNLFESNGAPKVLFLGSLQSDAEDDSPFLQVWNPRTNRKAIDVRSIPVGPLTQNECMEFVRRQANLREPQLASYTTTIFEESKGNPFLIEQLVEGMDTSSDGFKALPLGDTIFARLSQLPYQATSLLKLVAISGQPIEFEEVSDAAGMESPQLGTLTRMQNERLIQIVPRGSQTFVDTYHERIRDAVMQSISETQRKQLHLTLAETIEQRVDLQPDCVKAKLNEDQKTEDATPITNRIFDLAYHYKQAGDSRQFAYSIDSEDRSTHGRNRHSFSLFRF